MHVRGWDRENAARLRGLSFCELIQKGGYNVTPELHVTYKRVLLLA
jgi:hypothetical protein